MRALPRPLPFLVAAAATVGAALGYFLDPRHGRRRRHTTRDRSAALVRRGAHRARRVARHTSSDAYGLARRAAHRFSRDAGELDDATLAHKVESIVFRAGDVPKGQINVNAERGVVYLRGQVDRPELLRSLEQRVRKVRGVRGVENRLHLPE